MRFGAGRVTGVTARYFFETGYTHCRRQMNHMVTSYRAMFLAPLGPLRKTAIRGQVPLAAEVDVYRARRALSRGYCFNNGARASDGVSSRKHVRIA